MKLIIFGDTNRWNDAVGILTKYRTDVFILGLCSLDLGPYKDSDIAVTLREALELLHRGQIDGIVNVNGENPYYFALLENLGFPQIYVLPSYLYQQDQFQELSPQEMFLYPYKEVPPELMQIEFHLADHCNLNCKGCTHFSNLVPEPVFGNLPQFEKDLKQLSNLFSHIHTFFLLGGEPLLNPDVISYVKAVRISFPYTRIIIVTNGLLLLSMKSELISFLRENQIHISISAYNCLDIDKIRNFIQQHRLSAELRLEKDSFTKFLNPRGDSDPVEIFGQCIRRNCTYLGEGRIAACCLPFVVKYFNNYFGESIPEMESIDLYEPQLTGHEIQRRLTRPMELCRYCSTDVPYTWDVSKPPYEKEDWCV